MNEEVMNKRIKELAEQASHQSPDGYLVTIPYSNDFVKKFAKLIIKELINVISESREVRQTAYYYRNRLAEHFGVEEALKQEQEQEYEVLAGIGKGVEIPAGWKYYYIKPKLPLQLKQEQGEPVCDECGANGGYALYCLPCAEKYVKPEWVGLTDEDIQKLAAEQHDWESLYLAVQARLKEKNT